MKVNIEAAKVNKSKPKESKQLHNLKDNTSIEKHEKYDKYRPLGQSTLYSGYMSQNKNKSLSGISSKVARNKIKHSQITSANKSGYSSTNYSNNTQQKKASNIKTKSSKVNLVNLKFFLNSFADKISNSC